MSNPRVVEKHVLGGTMRVHELGNEAWIYTLVQKEKGNRRRLTWVLVLGERMETTICLEAPEEQDDCGHAWCECMHADGITDYSEWDVMTKERGSMYGLMLAAMMRTPPIEARGADGAAMRVAWSTAWKEAEEGHERWKKRVAYVGKRPRQQV